ncbi:MAG: RagB/SusD family nutrient uptake outer membrane protein [Prevotella sp.]|jgi:hypothetical protein|nr:RagB/SusD family nutrient uptake outer membrane protein [Prevotella sp.]MCI1324487.1 RagB/SusD family nutrient uptake outer membrane protein [Prevotella sp.]MCI1349246.1 RagB/SusD family nutrient uptake outer membrane protein [Prevotella sp.]MCI1415326.1 RagB/SusD family nutrient uptake outer membrane protein [Prevotella sp.]
MKRLSYLILLFPLLLASCLDETVKDRLTEDNTYSSASSLYVNAVATLYNYIGGNQDSQGLQGTYRGVYDYNTFSSDEAIIPVRGGDWYDGGFWENLYTHNWSASDGSLYDTWKYLYKVVVLCNQSLIIIDKNKSLLTDTQYQSFRAEVRAVRALYYAYIMDMYGNIPIASDTITVKNARQYSRPEVFRYIFSELQEVEPLLPDEHSNYEGNYYGRVTRPVVHFLLAKLALNAEVYTDSVWTDDERPEGKDIFFTVDGKRLNAWQTCIAYCDKITDEGYTLAANYASNFYIHNENSPENIFIIPMDKILYSNQYQYLFRSRHYAQGSAMGMGAENGSCATISTVHAYGYGTDSIDSRYAINFFSDTVRINDKVVKLDDGEPLIYRPLEVKINLTNSPYTQTAGAREKKYETDLTAYNDGKNIDNDIVLYRYADVLLMKAEAEVRNGADGDKELNEVRSRAGMPYRKATLQNILTERLLELMWEGWRRQDLIRFDLFHRSYDLRTAPAGEADRHTIVFPIPQKVLDLNTSIKQNTGY